MSQNVFPFRRATDPLMVPVGPSATKFDVPDGFFVTGPGKGATSFLVVNPNNFWVRLKGSNSNSNGGSGFAPVTSQTGWLFPPGFIGVFSTQFPDFMSALSVPFQGLEAGSGFIEISYGGGS